LKLAVIGEPCVDYIVRGSERTDKQYGGILYSVISLAVIAGKSVSVFPVMNLGSDEYDNIVSLLKKFGNIQTDFINKSANKTRVVTLTYRESASGYDRDENSTPPAQPIEFELIKDSLSKLDGILANMVSGVDMTLDTFKMIRENFSVYIHMDLHNLVMQTFPDGTRKRFPLKDWSKWCMVCDTIQMNEAEIAILTGDNVTEHETAEKILKSGCKAVVVTRGEAGASLYQLKSELKRTDISAVKNENFADSTGCGDVFASSFFYNNVKNGLKDFTEALNSANKTAGKNTTLNGIKELHKLN
jgi:sugar/nucleoside kinase (ribokinase family)